MKKNSKQYSVHEIISFWNSMKFLVIVSSNHEDMSFPLVWLFNFPPKCNFNIIIYTWNSCSKMGFTSFVKINFIHRHKFLGVIIYPQESFHLVSQFQSSSIKMMIHPCIGISFNGLHFHNLYKDWTEPKKKNLSLKLFKLLSKCRFKKTLKASLKGLLPSLKELIYYKYHNWMNKS